MPPKRRFIPDSYSAAVLKRSEVPFPDRSQFVALMVHLLGPSARPVGLSPLLTFSSAAVAVVSFADLRLDLKQSNNFFFF